MSEEWGGALAAVDGTKRFRASAHLRTRSGPPKFLEGCERIQTPARPAGRASPSASVQARYRASPPPAGASGALSPVLERNRGSKQIGSGRRPSRRSVRSMRCAPSKVSAASALADPAPRRTATQEQRAGGAARHGTGRSAACVRFPAWESSGLAETRGCARSGRTGRAKEQEYPADSPPDSEIRSPRSSGHRGRPGRPWILRKPISTARPQRIPPLTLAAASGRSPTSATAPAPCETFTARAAPARRGSGPRCRPPRRGAPIPPPRASVTDCASAAPAFRRRNGSQAPATGAGAADYGEGAHGSAAEEAVAIGLLQLPSPSSRMPRLQLRQAGVSRSTASMPARPPARSA